MQDETYPRDMSGERFDQIRPMLEQARKRTMNRPGFDGGRLV